MALKKYKDVSFRADSRERIELCNDIIDDYLNQGLRLTLRQLYYQLVTKNAITNEERSYQNLSALVSNARLAGLMDWEAIEDRVRQPRTQSDWNDVRELVESALSAYRLPRWEGQTSYVELWVEKDALAGVLEPLAREFHATLMVNRGYSSQSAMYEAAQRMLTHGDSLRVVPRIFYLGDHDPSGEDMVRDIRERLLMFGVDHIDVTKIALTTAQVKKYNPPPNPAKITDPRAKKYIAKHGAVSWEVDALPPQELQKLIRAAFVKVIDKQKMDAVKLREQSDKDALREAAENI